MKRVVVKKSSAGSIDLGSAASSSGAVQKRVHPRKEVIERKRSTLQRQGVASLEVRREHALKNSRLGAHNDRDVAIERERGSEPLVVTTRALVGVRMKTRGNLMFGVPSKMKKTSRLLPSNKHVDATTHSPSTGRDTVKKKLCGPVDDDNNIDRCSESDVGSDSDSLPPYISLSSHLESASPGAGFCDKLSCTFNPIEISLERLHDSLNMLSDQNERGYFLKRLGGIDGRLYRSSFELAHIGSDRQIAFIQMEPRRKEHNFFRFELNPNEIGPAGVYEVKRLLKALFGRRFRDDLRVGNITRLDAAVDAYKIRPDDLLVFSARARQSGLFQRIFDRSGRETCFIETHTIGSHTSDYFARCYDKTAQLSSVKAEEVDDLITRIEVKLQPRNEDGVTLKVEDISNARNPFSSLVIAYYPKPDGSDYVFDLFVFAARTVGAERALKIISDKRVRSRYWSLLQDSVPHWWRPDKHWNEVLESLKVTGLFPKDIFRGGGK